MISTFRTNLHKSRTDSLRTGHIGTKHGTLNSSTRSRGGGGFVSTFKPTFVDTFKSTYVNTFEPSRVTSSRPMKTSSGRHPRHHSFVYSHPAVFRPIVSPNYRHIIFYRNGPHYAFRYIHPYYHRKHVFVSLGGFWPVHYRYVRYYQYGYYPYAWYGYYPQVYEVEGDTYNYYIYEEQGDSNRAENELEYIDEDAIADAQEKLSAQTYKEPASESRADRYFEYGIKAFEGGNYSKAVYYFRSAVRVESDDIVLPFAYAQALFAGKQYEEAAGILRERITELSEEEKSVFYPRGLYPDDETLLGQIEELAARAARYPDNEELRFLLGYQYMGIGRYEEAAEQLRRLNSQSENTAAAAVLLDLIEKIMAEKLPPLF